MHVTHRPLGTPFAGVPVAHASPEIAGLVRDGAGVGEPGLPALVAPAEVGSEVVHREGRRVAVEREGAVLVSLHPAPVGGLPRHHTGDAERFRAEACPVVGLVVVALAADRGAVLAGGPGRAVDHVAATPVGDAAAGLVDLVLVPRRLADGDGA